LVIHAEHLDMGAEGCLAFPSMTTAHGPEHLAIPDPLTDREQIIRGIHRFADWLTAHPDAPAPTRIMAHHYHGTAAEVGKWADDSSAHRSMGQTAAWAELLVSAADPAIELTWFLERPAPAGWVPEDRDV
jgi:hypothetical protein